MIPLPGGMLDALAGSTGNARIQVNSWYNGACTFRDLPVTSYSFVADLSQPVQNLFTCTVMDATGELIPWTISDPLAVGGAKLQVQVLVGKMVAQAGFLPITTSRPRERWRAKGSGFKWVHNTTQIQLEAKDQAIMAVGAIFMSAESVPSGGTCISEIRRLLTGIMDVVVDPAVVDASVPSTVIYRTDRMAAIDALCSVMGAIYRPTPTGQLQVFMPPTTVSWVVSGGPEGEFMDLERSMRIEDFPNAAVSIGTAPNGAPLYGTAVQTTGDGYFDGPHGRWPVAHGANLVNTLASIQADAATTLANAQQNRTVEIPTRLAFNPGLQVGDLITVNVPILTGSTLPMNATVKRIAWKGNTSAPVEMDVTLRALPSALQPISIAMRRANPFGVI